MPTDTFEGAHLDDELTNPSIKFVAHLAQNVIADDVDSIVLADLVECNFPGYAPRVLTPGAIDVFDVETYAEGFFGEVTWESDVIVTPQVITACYVTVIVDGVGEVLNNIEILDSPLTIDKDGLKIVRGFSVMATSEAES